MSKPPQKNRVASEVDSTLNQQPFQQVQLQHQVYQGPIPHPDVLRGFETLVPGTAKRLIDMAEDESLHRRKLEAAALDANIATQKKQLEIADHQSKLVFWSDTMGQIAGTFVSSGCIVGSVWLALTNHEITAAALAALPIAAIIKAFFSPRKPSKPN